MLQALVTAPFDRDKVTGLDRKFDLEYSDIELEGEQFSPEELTDKLQGKDAVIVELQEVGREVMENVDDLKVVGCCRGGPVNIDIEAATDNDIVVFNSPGRNAEAVAELTIAMMIGYIRNMFQAAWDLGRKGDWGDENEKPYHKYKGTEIYGKTVGMVGFGKVAQELAKRLAGFGADLLVFDPYVAESEIADYGGKKVPLDRLLRKSDLVSLHARVNEETEGMIGAEEFKLMRDDALFVNTARAALVEEEAMIAALKQGEVDGAVLDVFHREPLPEDDPLLELGNVVLLPHIGGATSDVISHHTEIVSSAIVEFIEGRVPENIFNLEELGPRKTEAIRDNLVSRVEVG